MDNIIPVIIPTVYRALRDEVRDYRVEEIGGFCPFQATGTMSDPLGRKHFFYFHYRNGVASVEVSGPLFGNKDFRQSMSYGDPYGGALSADEFATVFTHLLPEVFITL